MTNQEIDNYLRASLVDEPVAFSFKQEVWRRIRSCDPGMPAGVLRFQPVAAVIGRPWGAIAGIAATVVLGLWWGRASLPDAQDPRTAYAMSISPFSHAEPK